MATPPPDASVSAEAQQPQQKNDQDSIDSDSQNYYSSPIKRRRTMRTWEARLQGLKEGGRQEDGICLAQVFSPRAVSNTGRDGEFQSPEKNLVHQSSLPSQHTDNVFTFRLEHRTVTGPMAQHRGEERILLFRSDRAGCVGKIVFSSDGGQWRQQLRAECIVPKGKGNGCSEADGQYENIILAKVHVLDVKDECRGKGLGSLLFTEACEALQRRYQQQAATDSNEDDGDVVPARDGLIPVPHILCQLDAEEDTRRHNKLVSFYECLGCSVKMNASVQYIFNNDGESYRKIPMQVVLKATLPSASSRRHDPTKQSLLGQKAFLPIQLLDASGTRIMFSRKSGMSERTGGKWLLVDGGEGRFHLRSTRGDIFVVTHDDGQAEISLGGDNKEERCLDSQNSFQILRVPESDDSDESQHPLMGPTIGQKGLWVLRTPQAKFLTANPYTHSLSCTAMPSFWQANSDTLSLVCTSDTPPRRIHYRNSWMKQTVERVLVMRRKFCQFNLQTMSLWDALEMASSMPFQAFRTDSGPGSSLQMYSFRVAERLRLAGHPDWMVLIGLLHELGRIVALLDAETAAKAEDSGYDWTVSCRSRVVGCRAPNMASFDEFRYLCPDEKDEQYNTPLGIYEEGCGLDNVMLSFTGTEYMYHFLKHNSIALPKEALMVLRLFPLGDWHSHGQYGALTTNEDEDIRMLVSDFDDTRREIRRECRRELGELPVDDINCIELWNSFYSKLAAKYALDGPLRW